MDGEGLLSLMASVLCLIACVASLFDDNTSKLESALLAFGICIFGVYAWTHTTPVFREELGAFINLLRL